MRSNRWFGWKGIGMESERGAGRADTGMLGLLMSLFIFFGLF